ncbi:hypothetical protein MMC31_000499, partial [Peltigera leucophlebia]|nr:hypothetical protein [Peltigera leucophlebia]
MENLLGPTSKSDDLRHSHKEVSNSVPRRARADLRELNIDRNGSSSIKIGPRRVATLPILGIKERISWGRALPFVHVPRGDENEPKENSPRRTATDGTIDSLPFDETKVWDQKLILSLDGGGIRGYSSLLILRELMKAIGEIEREWHASPAESSFHPLKPPSVDSDAPEYPKISTEHPETNASSPWLPCHYFDYMAGTSTGGLISIMLGRLRMSIDDCIAEYETLGPRVFAHPRLFHLRSPLFWPRDKYDHRSLEKAIRDVINRRSPFVAGGNKNFASDENRCRTIVLSYRKQESTGVETPYVFRSYDNFQRNEDPKKRLLHRNPGPADNNEIWKVARATSAAPTYFKPMKIDNDEYLDGGFGANNPCAEIYDEVRRMNNNAEHCVGVIVSIGTGKHLHGRFQGTGLKRYIGFVNFATKWASESEEVHTWMERLNLPCYARFNVETALGSIKLDEWRYRGTLRIKAGEAISKLRLRRRGHDRQTITKRENSLDSLSSSPPPPTAPSSYPSSSSSCSSQEGRKIPKYFRPKNETLEKITKHTEEYLSQPATKALILSYARRLVETRRARAHQDEERWEKNCHRIWYHCTIHQCPRGEERYASRDALRKHIRKRHGDHADSAEEEIERTLNR